MILCKNCSTRKECFYYQNGETRTECKFYKPMTEQEYIQTCNTEQLAELFVGVARDGADALKRCNGSFEPLNIYKHEFWVEWLKQPHTQVGAE